MRKHIVDCRIEGNMADALKTVYQVTNTFYVEMLEQILARSVLTKEEQIELIDRIITFVQKNQDGTYEVK